MRICSANSRRPPAAISASRPASSIKALLAIVLLLVGAGRATAQGGIAAGGGGGGASAPLTLSRDGIGATSTDAASLSNATPASVGAQQWSPRLRFTGSGWKTNATAGPQTVDWIVENQPTQEAANPLGRLTFSHQTNGGGYTPLIAFFGGNAGLDNVQNGLLEIAAGTGGTGSLGPLSGSDHINVTRNGNGTVIGFGSWNSGADQGQIGMSLNGFGVNSVQYSSISANVAAAFGSGDASGANVAGVNTTVYGGRSTGSGAGGSILFQTTAASGSSSTANTLATALTIDSSQQLQLAKKITQYNGITALGTGVSVTYGAPSATGLTAANTNFINYTPPATAGMYEVKGIINVTAWTTPASFVVTCTYTDASGTARTETMQVVRGSTGAVAAAITAVDRWYWTLPLFQINNSAAAITCSTSGTFTGTPVYNLGAVLQQVQ